ncbi:AbrB/MazE/SpoVT family DNA-binding domain-containing protein [uncultured Aquimonas sp.]|uniref:AbrB/MazE/SpoVT family DNA-binding domain-containing protein n=1 Tax=uncultured Aquimonas sp. TaxID=385483 RepID=UPI00086AE65A|nr:AbrB/MazE/SpoVT family DNA-binding domain-containing protein [uncultured Aquimonas sp.]ODU48348.1 MAG: transcriptional regulator [Xanthomonadaceae bacterium SCN 69-123]
MHTLRLVQIGTSLAVVLPRSAVERAGIGRGDTLYLTESADGLHLSTRNPALGEQMRTAHALMHERRALLQELAR